MICPECKHYRYVPDVKGSDAYECMSLDNGAKRTHCPIVGEAVFGAKIFRLFLQSLNHDGKCTHFESTC